MGALGDVGVHIIDYATFPAGPIREVYCRLQTFPKAPGDRIGDYHFDANDSATLNVEFANGALGVIHTTRWAPGHANRLALKICGSLGTLDLDSERATDSYRICCGRDGEPDFARGAEIQRVLAAAFASAAKHAPVRLKI